VFEPWRSLVVDEGQPARAQGTPAYDGDQPVILVAATGFWQPDEPIIMTVGLDTETDLGRYEGREATVVGTLVGDHLAVRRVSATSHAGAVSPARRRLSDLGEGAAERFTPRPSAEVALIDSGAVLSVWRDGSRTRAIVVDPAAEHALSDLHGDTLDVTYSRWPASTLRAIEQALADHEHLVRTVGNDIGSHNGQLRVAVVLHHVTTELAERLSLLTPDALALSVLIQPAQLRPGSAWARGGLVRLP
jgi:hypothetical protein